MKIKNLNFRSPYFLAPLAGYSDAPFRRIAREWGAACAVSEMVSAEGLARNSGKTEELLKRYDGEDQFIIQIFAPCLDPVSRCLDKLLEYNPTMIDINCGCPVPKVVKTGAGSAMMKNPDEINRIVSFLTRNTDIPVSVKFRLGWDSSSMNYKEFADAAYSGGASMMTLHARTRSQLYSGSADWSHIRNLKDHFKDKDVSIFASGDIFSAQDAIEVMKVSGCDGVMFARGAIGNPFIFRQTEEAMKGNIFEVSIEDRINTLLTHLSYMISWYGSDTACRDMRKHAANYVKGIKGASRAKQLINTAASYDDYRKALENPEALHGAPYKTPIGRPDEVKAARKPVLRYHWEE